MVELPRLSGADVVKALETLGFVVTRQRGRRIVMGRGSSGCVVPNHRELKTGTSAGILKQADITSQAFIDALRRN